MKRLGEWWFAAERVCAALFEPRIDVSTSDREIEALLRGSWLGSGAESLVARFRAAWLDSRCRSLLRAATHSRS
jgi:hypothetical protein